MNLRITGKECQCADSKTLMNLKLQYPKERRNVVRGNAFQCTYLERQKLHLPQSSNNISQALLNVENTFEIEVVPITETEPPTKQEHR